MGSASESRRTWDDVDDVEQVGRQRERHGQDSDAPHYGTWPRPNVASRQARSWSTGIDDAGCMGRKQKPGTRIADRYCEEREGGERVGRGWRGHKGRDEARKRANSDWMGLDLDGEQLMQRGPILEFALKEEGAAGDVPGMAVVV